MGLRVHLGYPFQPQKLCFEVEPAAKSGETPIRTNHSVARDHHGNRVFADGTAYCSVGFRISGCSRDVGIAPGLTVGDLLETTPHSALK